MGRDSHGYPGRDRVRAQADQEHALRGRGRSQDDDVMSPTTSVAVERASVEELAADVVFKSSIRWQPRYSGELVVFCSDGRYNAAVMEFLERHCRMNIPDRLSVPGGPATILLSAPFFFAERAKFETLAVKHNVHRVVGIMHQDCAYYQTKYPDWTDERRRTKQEADLAEFRKEVLRLHPSAAVELYYAEPSDGCIQFRRAP